MDWIVHKVKGDKAKGDLKFNNKIIKHLPKKKKPNSCAFFYTYWNSVWKLDNLGHTDDDFR